MDISHTRLSLASDLTNLGIGPGDIVFIHSSFKSIGKVDGGAGTLVLAIEDAVGPDGLILMPSFNLVEYDNRPKTWNIDTTPSTVGWLTEYFRNLDDTHRSDHYSHSVAARGKDANNFVSGYSRDGYKSNWDLEPWSKPFGAQSPMNLAYKKCGKLLMLGVDYTSSTYLHFVETIHWNMVLRENPESLYPLLDRTAVGKFWDREGEMETSSVGNAKCRLFGIKPYVQKVLKEVSDNPNPYWLNFKIVPGTRKRVYS